MLKTQPIIEIYKGDRVYTFVMPVNAPVGEAYDAAFQVLKNISDLAQQSVQSAQPQVASDVEITKN